jgi:hypothetical protein
MKIKQYGRKKWQIHKLHMRCYRTILPRFSVTTKIKYFFTVNMYSILESFDLWHELFHSASINHASIKDKHDTVYPVFNFRLTAKMCVTLGYFWPWIEL